MDIKAINDYLIVELTKNTNGIVTADSGESITRGVVVAIPDMDKTSYFTGTGWIQKIGEINITVPDVGESIFFKKYADSDGAFTADNKNYAFIKLSDVMGYVEVKK